MKEWLWLSEWMNERTNEWMNEWINEWTREWMKEGRKEGRNAWMKAWISEICQSSSKSAPNASVLLTIDVTNYLLDDDVVDIWNRARATVSCTFSRPHLPKVLRMWQFLRCSCETELSLQSRAHFATSIPVHFLSTAFPDRAAQPRKQRPSFGDRGSHFTWISGFRTRESFQAWIHALPCSRPGDDVLDMMRWLT